MNTIKYSTIIGLGALLGLSVVSCKNSDVDFPDHQDGIVAYFANQYPVKTITLGEDSEQDNSLDNEHKFKIFATHGGSYEPRELSIDVVVDNALVDGLTFDSEGKHQVKAMPENYYTLASTTFNHDHGFFYGSEVKLTDAFFADPDVIRNTYVIPLRMVAARGADRINSGEAVDPESNPSRSDVTAWNVQPKDFVLYCVKYVNEWDASYLRRGIDRITENGVTTEVKRHKDYVERDEVVNLTTESLNACIFPVSTVVDDGSESGKTETCDLKLAFAADGTCTITSNTPGITASGTGKFVKRGEKKSWDNRDRDALYMEYSINFGTRQYSTLDTLVMRTRDIASEYFNPTYTK